MIDLSALDSLSLEEKKTPQPPKTSEPLEDSFSSTPQLEKIKEERARLREAYKDYQDKIKDSSDLRISINKGLKSGESIESLFLKAVKCISLMTGDTTIYTGAHRSLVELYSVPEEKLPKL